MDVLIFRVDDDVRITNRVFAGFVDPRVQGRDVSVMDLFSLSFIGNLMEFDSIGSASEEGIFWVAEGLLSRRSREIVVTVDCFLLHCPSHIPIVL